MPRMKNLNESGNHLKYFGKFQMFYLIEIVYFKILLAYFIIILNCLMLERILSSYV